ncbi:MAG: TAXI family TRAP transporter solute-binding subunit [Tissierellaceae bacterium]
MKRRFISIILVLLVIASIISGCGSTKKEDVYISIATGGTGGTYYPLGGALAKVFNDNVEGVNANVQSTGASVENVGLVANGEAEIAFIQNDITYYALTGTENFEGKDKITNLRGMAMWYPEVVQIIATESSGIETIEDLRGKKVAIGAPGSGVEANARQILGVHGMTYDDLGKADYLSFNEAADQIKDNQIDAAFVTAGLPTSAITELGQTAKIVLVPIDSQKIAELNEEFPFYTEVVIPADTYGGQDRDVAAAAVMAMIVVPEELDEDLVYNMTKQMFEQKQVIVDTHSRGNDLSLETALSGMPVELHSGAKRYYDEKGVK